MPWNSLRRPKPAVGHGHGEEDHRIRAAYERGRRDERARRKRHPILMTLTVAVAMVGAASLALAGLEGSFARGGSVLDHNLSVAANRAAGEASQVMNRARPVDSATDAEG